jgi:hypothetical protein
MMRHCLDAEQAGTISIINSIFLVLLLNSNHFLVKITHETFEHTVDTIFATTASTFTIFIVT